MESYEKETVNTSTAAHYTEGPIFIGAETETHVCLNADGPRCIVHVLKPTPILSHTEEMAREEMRANAAFIAEAFSVAAETGMTPRQLAEQRAELIGVCKRVLPLLPEAPAAKECRLECEVSA